MAGLLSQRVEYGLGHRLTAVRQSTPPSQPFYGFVVGEQATVASVRRHWVATGQPKQHSTFCGYWRHGPAANLEEHGQHVIVRGNNRGRALPSMGTRTVRLSTELPLPAQRAAALARKPELMTYVLSPLLYMRRLDIPDTVEPGVTGSARL